MEDQDDIPSNEVISGVTVEELALGLEISPADAQEQIRQLIVLEIIEEVENGQDTRYRLLSDGLTKMEALAGERASEKE